MAGLLCALGAYLAWGLLPLYWKQVRHVDSREILAHRIVWSLAFLATLLTVTRRWGHVFKALRDSRTRGALLLSTSLVSFNWGLYIWAVNSDRVTESSLGYYMNPILNVVLARLVLREELRPVAWLALGLATIGVTYLAIGLGAAPWVAFALALSFSLYGLVRKRAGVDPLTGLAVEVGLATPFALAYLLLAASELRVGDVVWLAGSGVATSIPLLLFAAAVARLRYSTLGIVQYLSPTCQLGLAVFAFGEPFTRTHAVTFAFVWTAVALYAGDAVRASMKPKG